jgi:hypothetical protein
MNNVYHGDFGSPGAAQELRVSGEVRNFPWNSRNTRRSQRGATGAVSSIGRPSVHGEGIEYRQGKSISFVVRDSDRSASRHPATPSLGRAALGALALAPMHCAAWHCARLRQSKVPAPSCRRRRPRVCQNPWRLAGGRPTIPSARSWRCAWRPARSAFSSSGRAAKTPGRRKRSAGALMSGPRPTPRIARRRPSPSRKRSRREPARPESHRRAVALVGRRSNGHNQTVHGSGSNP